MRKNMTAYTDSTKGTYPKFDLQKKEDKKNRKGTGSYVSNTFRNRSIFNVN